MDRHRPIADRTFGIGPHDVDQRLIVSFPLGEPAAEIGGAVGARLSMTGAIGLTPPTCSTRLRLRFSLCQRVDADRPSDKLQDVSMPRGDDEGRSERGGAVTQSGGESVREETEPGCLRHFARATRGTRLSGARNWLKVMDLALGGEISGGS
jgi:hypothetical protein